MPSPSLSIAEDVAPGVVVYDAFHPFISWVLLKANSKVPDEMPHDAAFHQGLHCLLR